MKLMFVALTKLFSLFEYLSFLLIEQLLRRLLQVPGAGAERHSGGPLLHAHVPELAEHLVKVRILKMQEYS